MTTRSDGRTYDQLRPVEMIPGYVEYPEGSVLIVIGKTKVLCNVTLEDGVPRWMLKQGVPGGWITGEYAMLPRATLERTRRDTQGPNARAQEIRRLIGRSLRSAFDLPKLGLITCTVDCDVIQADGGTRTAAVTGGYLALRIALESRLKSGAIPRAALKSPIAAVSVGIVAGQPCLDLCYEEDSRAEVDANIVMTGSGDFVEIQGTAEGAAFNRQQLDQLLSLASKGITELIALQNETLRLCHIA